MAILVQVIIFSSPELKAQVSFSDRLSSVCPSVCKRFLFLTSSQKPLGQFQPSTKHPWVKGIHVCTNERSCPFPRGYNYKIVKIHWRNYKIFSKRTGPNSTKCRSHSWVKGIQVCSNEELFNSYKVDNGVFLLLINILIIICVYWFELFSQVSDLAHGPLVFISGRFFFLFASKAKSFCFKKCWS